MQAFLLALLATVTLASNARLKQTNTALRQALKSLEESVSTSNGEERAVGGGCGNEYAPVCSSPDEKTYRNKCLFEQATKYLDQKIGYACACIGDRDGNMSGQRFVEDTCGARCLVEFGGVRAKGHNIDGACCPLKMVIWEEISRIQVMRGGKIHKHTPFTKAVGCCKCGTWPKGYTGECTTDTDYKDSWESEDQGFYNCYPDEDQSGLMCKTHDKDDWIDGMWTQANMCCPDRYWSWTNADQFFCKRNDVLRLRNSATNEEEAVEKMRRGGTQ